MVEILSALNEIRPFCLTISRCTIMSYPLCLPIRSQRLIMPSRPSCVAVTTRPLCLPIKSKRLIMPSRPSCVAVTTRPLCLPIKNQRLMSRPSCPMNMNIPSFISCPFFFPAMIRPVSGLMMIDHTLADDRFLLQEIDLFPSNKHFLKKCTIEEFRKQFGMPPKVITNHCGNNNTPFRLNVVLPLHTPEDHGTVVPIPFIIDTGAPYDFHLGTGAIKALHKMRLMKEVEGLRSEVGRLMGSLCYKDRETVRPIVNKMPIYFELAGGIQGDVRVNIIGLPAILRFKLCTCE